MNDLDIYRYRPDPKGLLLPASPPAEPKPKTDTISLTGLIAAFRRHLWRFMVIVGGVTMAAIGFTMLETPTYIATARVAIDTRAVQVAPASVSGATDAPVVSSIPNESSAIDTEVAVINSRSVAERVVTALHLDSDPEFRPKPGPAHLSALAKLKKALGSVIGHHGAAVAPAPNSAMDYAINAVLSRLKVSRFNLTTAIDISFLDADPNKAATIANAFAQNYIMGQIDSKFETNQQAGTFLKSQISQMLQQYMSDVGKLQQYRIAHNLLSTGATTLTEQEISNYNQSEVEAKAEAAADQANVDTARAQLAHGSTGEDVGGALSSGVIQSLRAQRATISAHVADLQSRYGDKYPELMVARRQLADVDQQIQAEINRVISNLEAKAEVSRRRVQSIAGSLAETHGTLSENNEAQVGLDQLQQNADASRSLYESYLNRLKETAAQEGGERSDARILSTAPTPTQPASPHVLLNLLLGMVLGVGGGAAAVVASELAETGITTADEVEQQLGQHYLGGIPLLSSVEGRAGASPLDEVVREPHSAYSEAFRNLRASIHYASPGEHPRVVAISSALPKEGKTTVAISLARSAALNGVSTILVDCDIRHRGVNRILDEMDDQPGLIEVLTGSAALSDAIMIDESSGAAVLPLKATASPRRDLFGSKEMEALIDDLRQSYEFVVLDAPPLLPVADGRVIAAQADMLILLMRWCKTDAPAVTNALRLLPRERVRLGGVVLTQVDVQKQARSGYGDPGFYYEKYKEYYS